MALRVAVVVSQPPGFGGYAVARPPRDGGRERLGRRFLGDVEVAEAAREVGNHPCPLLVVGTGDRLPDSETGHGSDRARTGSVVGKVVPGRRAHFSPEP